MLVLQWYVASTADVPRRALCVPCSRSLAAAFARRVAPAWMQPQRQCEIGGARYAVVARILKGRIVTSTVQGTARDSTPVWRRRTEREEREGRASQGPAAPCSTQRQKWTWKTCMRSPAKRGYTEVHGPQACRVHHSSRGDGSTPLKRRLTCETTHGVVDWPWSSERYIMPNRGGAKKRPVNRHSGCGERWSPSTHQAVPALGSEKVDQKHEAKPSDAPP